MKIYTALLISSLVFVVSSKQADYYWRNFNGEIPDDAFEAAQDTNGKSIYIGQGLFMKNNVGLIPGTLYEGILNITVTAQMKVFSTSKFIKILCTQHPHHFRWIPVTGYSDITSLSNVHLIEAGVETDKDLHIGRVFHEGNTEIGKIYHLSPSRGALLNIPNYHNTESTYEKFDILVYKLNVCLVGC